MNKKVLLILVDGMRPDALPASPIAMDMLAKYPHSLTTQTVMPSITLPCHMSLFHSVDPTRHNNLTNTYCTQVRPVNGLIEVLKAAKKNCGFFYNWEELRDLSRPGNLAQSCFFAGRVYGYDKAIEMTTDAAIAFTQCDAADFAFVYYGFPDAAGHGAGWMTEEYLESIRASWKCIDRLCATLSEKWTAIITADHGGHDRMHGMDVPEDMTIPLIFRGTEKPDFTDSNIKDIAPTIVHLMGVEADPVWEGRSLL